jgi:hypothetical protein
MEREADTASALRRDTLGLLPEPGDRLGVPANAKATRATTLAAMGQFDNVPGVGQGTAAFLLEPL